MMLSFTICANAYDYTIKDEYGRVSGYAIEKDNKLIVVDRYGNKEYTVKNGIIYNLYGKKIGEVKVNQLK